MVTMNSDRDPNEQVTPEPAEEHREGPPPEDYTVWEMVFWLAGIVAIPLVPIVMIMLLTPWSGM